MELARYVAILGLSFLCVNQALAQQDPQFTQNMNNRLFVNPAFAGMNNAICAYMLGRQQWVGFEGRPESYLFGVHGEYTLPFVNVQSGSGLNIISDRVGQNHHLGVKGSYSLHLPVNIFANDPGTLGIGVALGFLQLSVGNNWRAVDQFFGDPSIPDNGLQKSGFDFDFGLYYKTSKGLYIGASATHLTQTKFEEGGEGLGGGFANNPEVVDWNISYEMAAHYYLMAGYDIPLPNNPLFVLQPSVFLKSDAVSAQVDLNMNVEYNNMFWGGVSWRYIDAFALLGGINWSPGIIPGGLRFGYAYDVTTSRINTGSSGSHELFLQYCLQLKKPVPVQKHKSPRFL